jgi:class 3 adenylate cyclase
MKYTTVGDTVNTAARLESFRKEDFEEETLEGAATRFRILVGESTRVQLGDAFELESLGAHALRGRGQPIGIYRVRGARGSEWREGGAT